MADLRQTLLQKYSAPATPANTGINTGGGNTLTVKSSPYETTQPRTREELLAKYSGTQPGAAPRISVGQADQSTIQGFGGNQPGILESNRPIVVPINTTPKSTTVDLEPTFFDKVKNFFGIDTPKRQALVFEMTPEQSRKAVFRAQQMNQADFNLRRAISGNKTVAELTMSPEPYDYERLGQQWVMNGLSQILPKSLIRAAASPGSVADQYLSGVLDPNSVAEQVAAYSGAAGGSALMFATGVPIFTRALAKVPGFISLATAYPKIASTIAGGLAFAGTGAVSDIFQEQKGSTTLRNIPGNFLTGAGFGAFRGEGAVKVGATVFGTSFLGEKIKGAENMEALISASFNTLFAGAEEYLNAGNVKKFQDTVVDNAFRELGLKPGATQEQIKQSYRKLAHSTHPDKGGDAQEFAKINAAYQVAKEAKTPVAPGQRSFIDEMQQFYRDVKSGTVLDNIRPPVSNPPTPATATQTPANQPASTPATTGTSPQAPQSTPVALNPAVGAAMAKPLTPSVAAKLRSLREDQVPAFSREIQDHISKSLGVEGSPNSENGITFRNYASKDGRPAQFNLQGKIEFFLPSFNSDIDYLMTGQPMRIHEGPDVQVFQKKEGESLNDLVERYAREVVFHEIGHKETQTIEETIKLGELTAARQEAVINQDNEAKLQIQKELNEYMSQLEQTANKYVRENRGMLEEKFVSTIKKTSDIAAAARNPVEETLTKIEKNTSIVDPDEYAAVLEQSLQFADSEMETNYERFKKIYNSMKKKPEDEAQFKRLLAESKSENLRNVSATAVDNMLYSSDQEFTNDEVFDQFVSRVEAEWELKGTLRELRAQKKEIARTEAEKRLFLNEMKSKIRRALENESRRIKIRNQRRAAVEKAVTRVKTKYEEKLQAIADRKASIQAIKEDLVAYIDRFLPIESRKSFERAVLRTTTDAQLQKEIARIDKEADLIQRNKLAKKIESELASTVVKTRGGVPSNVKFSYNAQKKLDFIRKNFKGDYAKAQDTINELIAGHRAETEGPLSTEVMEQIQLLKMVGVADMSAAQLENVLLDIQSIKETGRTRFEVEQFEKDLRTQRTIDGAYLTITGGQELVANSNQIVKQKPDITWRKKVKDFLTIQQYGWRDIMDKLSYYDKYSKPFESFLSKLGDKAHSAYRVQNAGEVAKTQQVSDALKRIYGVQKNRDVFRLINDLKQIYVIPNVKRLDGKPAELRISRDQAIKKYMEHQDPTLDASFEQMGWGEDVWNAIDSVLTNRDIEFAKWQIEFYQEYYPEINQVYRSEYGVDLPFNKNYSPVMRDVEDLMPENVLLAKEIKEYASAKNSSLKLRKKNTVDLQTHGSLEVINRHIVKMEHYKAWGETMGEYRKVFMNKEVRAAVLELHGPDMVKVIDNFLNDMARDGVAREKINRVADKIRANVTSSILGINPNVAWKQVSGVFNYLMALPVKDYFVGIADFWTAPLKKANFLYQNSPIFQERFGEGYERDIAFAIEKGYDKRLSGVGSWKEKVFYLIRTADKVTVYHGAWASFHSKYTELTGAGFNLNNYNKSAANEAIEYAERVTNTVQETSQLDTLSNLQRGGSFIKLLTMFQSQPNKYLRIAFGAIRNLKAGRGSRASNIKQLLLAWFVLPMLFQFLADGLKVDAKKQATVATLGPFAYPLILGQFITSMAGWIAGSNTYDYQPSAVLGIATDLKRGIEDLSKDEPEQIWRGITRLVDAGGKLTGVPTTVFTKPIRNALKDELEEP